MRLFDPLQWCTKLLVVGVLLVACSTIEPTAENTDTTTESDAEDTKNTCLDSYDPHWMMLLVEVGDGPSVGLDAVVLTHECDDSRYYGTKIEYHTDPSTLSEADVKAVVSMPDASPTDCADHALTLASGEFIMLQLGDNVHPGDLLEVVVVDPESCEPAQSTSHLAISIATGFGLDSAVQIGTGAVVTVPDWDEGGWVVP